MTLAALSPAAGENAGGHYELLHPKDTAAGKLRVRLADELKKAAVPPRRNFNMTTNSFVVQPTFAMTRNDAFLAQDSMLMTSGTFDPEPAHPAPKRSSK